jgi:hypothetical protein
MVNGRDLFLVDGMDVVLVHERDLVLVNGRDLVLVDGRDLVGGRKGPCLSKWEGLGPGRMEQPKPGPGRWDGLFRVDGRDLFQVDGRDLFLKM